MELKKLDISFYTANPRVEHALDFYMNSGQWDMTKIRGHGIVSITINGLVFAIPVRSNILHDASYILKKNTQKRWVKGMGLDYTKALLIRDPAYVKNEIFVLKGKDAGKKLIGKTEHITNQFQKYVEKYINATKVNDQNILSDLQYKDTTLINYHTELGI
jgi:protein AbiQ